MSDFYNAILNFANAGPQLQDALNALKREIMLTLNCHAVATVQSFNSEERTIRARINYQKSFLKQNPDGTTSPINVDYPILIDVPIIVLSGGGASLTFPIRQGDIALILFNDRSLDMWLTSGKVGPLNSSRLHSFSDGIALIGLLPFNQVPADYDEERPVLRNGETFLAVGEEKLELANEDTTLNTVLQDLVTNIKSLVTQVAAITVTCATAGNPSSPPINVDAINAITAQLTTTANEIGGLLE